MFLSALDHFYVIKKNIKLVSWTFIPFSKLLVKRPLKMFSNKKKKMLHEEGKYLSSDKPNQMW